MLLPDNIKPEFSIYYIGSIVLSSFKTDAKISLMDLFQLCKNKQNISFNSFLLSLDWLFLIDAVKLNENGEFFICS